MKLEVPVEKTDLIDAIKKHNLEHQEKTHKLAIVIGHTKKRPGAYGVEPIGMNEYDYNMHLAELIKECGKISGVSVKVFTRDDVGIKGCYDLVEKWKPDACIELHFNSYNSTVQGTETLYSDDNDGKGVREKKLARLVNDGMLKALGSHRNDRGLKERPSSERERGWFNVNQVNGFASILIEPFFGDNPSEAEVAVEKKEVLAGNIIDAFLAWK